MAIFLSILLLALFSATARGLTIYRIGGDPTYVHPMAGTPGVQVRMMTWEEFADGYDFQKEGLDFSGGGLAPMLATPDFNLALDASERRAGLPTYPDQEYGTVGSGPRGWAVHWPPNLTIAPFYEKSVDGDLTTYVSLKDLIKNVLGEYVLLFLGDSFPVNRVVLRSPPDHPGSFIPEFRVLGWAPGSKVNRETVIRGGDMVLADVTENRKLEIDIRFPTVVLDRLLFIMPRRKYDDWELAEFEVYGSGYVPYGLYQSQVFELEAESSLGEIRFAGFKDPDATVRIRTRSGRDDDPLRYWRLTGRGREKTYRNPDGTPLTRADWLKISGGKIAETTLDVDNWSSWAPYAFADSAGTAITSPGPRQFFQLQVELVPQGQDGCGLDFLEFEVTNPPVVGQVVGEIWPVQVKPGEETPFTYALLPTFTGSEAGFDRLLLRTSGQFTKVDSVRVLGVPVQWSLVEPLEDSRVFLQLEERIEESDSEKLIEVFFHGRVFRFGTVFSAQVFDSERPLEVGQFVDEGDATFRLDSNQRMVGIELGSNIIDRMVAVPRVITPNGDSVNDRLMIQYTVYKLAGSGDVRVDIYDLSGQRVRQVYRGEASSGRYEKEWNGLGDDGRMVPPGIYLYRVRVDMDEGEEEPSGLLAVVY